VIVNGSETPSSATTWNGPWRVWTFSHLRLASRPLRVARPIVPLGPVQVVPGDREALRTALAREDEKLLIHVASVEVRAADRVIQAPAEEEVGAVARQPVGDAAAELLRENDEAALEGAGPFATPRRIS